MWGPSFGLYHTDEWSISGSFIQWSNQCYIWTIFKVLLCFGCLIFAFINYRSEFSFPKAENETKQQLNAEQRRGLNLLLFVWRCSTMRPVVLLFCLVQDDCVNISNHRLFEIGGSYHISLKGITHCSVFPRCCCSYIWCVHLGFWSFQQQRCCMLHANLAVMEDWSFFSMQRPHVQIAAWIMHITDDIFLTLS